MQLDNRSSNLLQEVINNPAIKNKDLEKKYNLSRRQIGYSFEKINEWLKDNNLPKIERTRNGVFLVNPILFTTMQKEQELEVVDTYVLPEHSRANIIILLLLSRNEEISLLHFTSALDVSKNTILSDLKTAQSIVEQYELNIKYSRQYGYSIEGDEFQKRKLLIDITNKVIDMYNGEALVLQIANLTEKEISDIRERVEQVEGKLNLKFTDEKINSLPYVLSLIYRRIKQGKIISLFLIDNNELTETKEYKAVEEILCNLENIPMEERLFISLQLLTSNVSSSELLTEETIPELIRAIDETLKLFEKQACIILQDKNQLLNKILLHLKPAYYRIKFKLTTSNTMLESVSQEFEELHHIVKKSIKPLSNLIGCDIPESESTYITMLIGGWLTRQGDSIHQKIKALVVCPNGVSISRLMESALRELFPEFVFLDSLSIREFQNFTLDYDVVFSPVFLNTDKKLFIAKSFLEREEKDRLRRQVMMELYGYPTNVNLEHVIDIIEKHGEIHNKQALKNELHHYFNSEYTSLVKQHTEPKKPNLYEFITPETITLKESASSWEEAIRISAEPLLKKGTITPDYIQAMIEHHNPEDPYIIIGQGLAIPHASPDEGVNEVSMSLLSLKHPVEFSSELSVKIVVVIAALDKHQHLRAMMQLMKLAGNKEDVQSISSVQTGVEVYDILRKYTLAE
ncbi:BglG family transcription antiterminator [Metabacillus idriensis]|uniref:BglG family transcription antiterminator n=1 Tax=Metabacillus idriensis TaxID=324768 RepID=UPI00174886BB|nr:BglG family transcription antiterminator [Metabacillus idriensis]